MMKQKLGILVLLLPFFLVACSDDDQDVAATNSLQVLSSSVFFSSQGGTGSVEVKSATPVTAVSGSAWCQVSVSGQTIQLSAERNNTLEGRSALITISNGEASTTLTAQQRGIVYQFDHQARYVYGDTAVAKSLSIVFDNPTTVTTSAEWLSAYIEDNTLHYSSTDNTSGTIRSAWVHVKSGEYVDSFKVLQYDAQKDILGKYRLAGTVANGSTVEYEGTLGYTGKTLYFRVPSMNWNIALMLAENEPTLYIKNTEYAGRYRADDGVNYYVSMLTCALVDGNFQLNLSSSYGMMAPLDYDSQLQTTVGRFVDDGSWSRTGYTPNSLLLWLSTARSPSTDNSAGYLEGLVNPYFYRIDI